MIKEIVILSGKGGTGKTSLTACFAAMAENKVLCDADVDAADLHLLSAPRIKETTEFKGGNKAVIQSDKCTQCGICLEVCQFNAVDEDFQVNALDCEGCGVCVDLCPEQAIKFPSVVCGQWFVSESRFGPMVHARLGIAQENSGKLVTQVRQEARNVCRESQHDLIITDGPPGIGCPVIASIGQATAVLAITEPTVSGIHDLDRVLALTDHFNVPAMICINKFDLNLEQTAAIEQLAEQKKISVLGKIPFDPIFIDAMVAGQTVVEYEQHSKASLAVQQIWQNAMADRAMENTRLM